MTRAETIAILQQHCRAIEAVDSQLDLKATQEKAAREVVRLKDLKDWCEQAEVENVTEQLAIACRVLQVVEAFQRILRDYREGIA
jgi:hypothetical protein